MELTQYNPSVDLHAAVTLRLEFPMAGRAVAAIAVGPFPLLRLSGGVTLQLVMMVSSATLLLSVRPVERNLGLPSHSLGLPPFQPSYRLLRGPCAQGPGTIVPPWQPCSQSQP